MGKKRLPWWLRYKRISRDHSTAPFIPFDRLEKIELQKLQSPNIGANPFTGGNKQLEERIKTVRIGTRLDELDKLVNKTMEEIDGKYVDLKVHSLGLQHIATIVFIPNGGGRG